MADAHAIALLRLQLRVKHGHARPPARLPRMPVPRFPDELAARYQQALLAHLAKLEEAARWFLSQLGPIEAAAARARGDSWFDDLERLSEAFKRRVAERAQLDARELTRTFAAGLSSWNRREWRAAVKAVLGVDVFATEPWLRDQLEGWAKTNADLITTQTEDVVRRTQSLVEVGLRQGRRHEDVAKDLTDRFGVERSRAQFIAQDQTAKLNADLTEQRQTDLGVTKYTWHTSRDQHVRGAPQNGIGGLYPKAVPSHVAREGKVFSWAKAPAGGHPGQDYRCRCTAAADLSHILVGLEEVSA